MPLKPIKGMPLAFDFSFLYNNQLEYIFLLVCINTQNMLKREAMKQGKLWNTFNFGSNYITIEPGANLVYDCFSFLSVIQVLTF
jgi:hypothetical protein